MLNDHRSALGYPSMSRTLGSAQRTQYGSPQSLQTFSQLNSLGQRPQPIRPKPGSLSTPTTETCGGTLMKIFKKLFCKKKLTSCEELTYRVEEHKTAQGEVFFYAIVKRDGSDTFASYYDSGPKWRYKKTLYWRSQVGYSSFGGVTSCKVQFPDKDLAKDMCIDRCREIRNLKHNRVVEEGKCQSE